MDAKDLTLNIAVNLGRMARWAIEGKTKRIEQFMVETERYLIELENVSRGPRFEKTYKIFKQRFKAFKNNSHHDAAWAEELLTWANILTHRAKLNLKGRVLENCVLKGGVT